MSARVHEALERRLLLAAPLPVPTVQSEWNLNANGSDIARFSLFQQSILAGGFDASNFDLFLKLSNIPGESQDAGHVGEIDLDAFNWGVENTSTGGLGGGGGEGKAIIAEPHFVSHLSKASPLIMKGVATGTHIPSAILTVQKKSGGEKVLQATFTDVLIGSYELTTANDGKPAEEYTLAFDGVEFQYIPQKADGTADAPVVFGFDTSLGVDFSPYAPTQKPLLDGFATAAVDMFLDVDGVDGDSTDVGHPGWIDVDSYQWALDTIPVTAGGGASGSKAFIGEMQFVTHVSKASPKLMQFCASGQHIPNATFEMLKSGGGGQVFLHTELSGVLVSSYQVTTGLNGRLQEEFTLQFDHIDLEYTPRDAAGDAQPAVEFNFNTSTADTLPFVPAQIALLDHGFASPLEELYLDLDGVPGDATRVGHQDEIELLSYSWGVDGPPAPTGGGAGTGKAKFNELHFVANISKASPKLFERSAVGTHIPDATFAVFRPSLGQDIYLVELHDVIVDGYKLTTALHGTLQEEFSLRFDESMITVKPFKNDGSAEPPVEAQFDVSVLGAGIVDDAPSQLALLDSDYAAPVNDLFLKIDNVAGESKDADHPGEIEIDSYQWGLDGANATLHTVLHEMHFVSHVSKASPKLVQLMLTGTHEPKAVFVARKGGGHPIEYLTVTMSDVLVSSYQIESSHGGGGLLEEYTLSFGKVEFEYVPQNAAGGALPAVAAVYDLLINGGTFEHFAPPQKALLDQLPNSSFDIFLNIPGIPGDSIDDDHKGQIDVDSFDWLGHLPPVFGGGGGAGGSKASLAPIHVVSPISKASPLLIQKVTNGTHIPQVDAYVRSQGAKAIEFLHVVLKEVTISSYHVTSSPDGLLKEEYTLTFGEIRFEYRPQKADGTADAPVVVDYNARLAGAAIQPFAPPQNALLNRPDVDASNLDAILDLPGIAGESTDENHPGGIDIVAMDWGVYNTSTGGVGGGAGAGKAVFNELHLLTHVSKATPRLLEASVSGRHFPQAVINFRAPGDASIEFLRIALSDVLVGTDKITSEVGGTLFEEFTLRFGKEVTQFNPGGVPDPTGPGVFQFSSPTYSVDEDGGLATITVQRVGGIGGAASVDYATADGTAGKHDYVAASGKLTFTPGQTSQTFTVRIKDDNAREPHETVNLLLKNPSAPATIGPGGTAVLTILDNEPRIVVDTRNKVNTAKKSSLFSGELATFTDMDFAVASAFNVLINWGDGTSSAGTIGFDSKKGEWTVSGAHTYAADGNFLVLVTVTDTNGAAGSATTTVKVK